MINLGIKAKLIVLFVILKVIPLAIIAFIAISGVKEIEDYFLKNNLKTNFEIIKKTIKDTTLKSIDDSVVAIDNISRESLEKIAFNTAQNVARFLYERDKDLLFLSTLPLNQQIIKNFHKNKSIETIYHGDYRYDDNQSRWVKVSKTTSSLRNDITVLKDNKRNFHFVDPQILKTKTLPIYKEVVFFDLNGEEIYKSSNINSNLQNISDINNTYCKAENYFQKIKNLKKGEIYVSDVIGAYVKSKVIGTYTKKRKEIFNPKESAYAGVENPVGKRFEAIIRFITPVFKNNKKIGYISLALDHRHIMDFTDTLSIENSKVKQDIADASNGNYAFMWDSNHRCISHPRDYFIVGFNPNTGKRVTPWLSKSVVDDFKKSKQKNIDEFLKTYPWFKNQSLKQKPNITQLKKDGNIGLDCRYLNFAPQCFGWEQVTKEGGYGSFVIFWSGVWKLTTAATIPYYSGKYGESKRGFGFVTIGKSLDKIHESVITTKDNIDNILTKQTKNMKISLNVNNKMLSSYTNTIIDKFTIITALMIIAVVLIAIWLSEYLTNRINNLIIGAKKFSKNELDYEIKVSSNDEIGKLETAFNSMSRNIKILIENQLKQSKELQEAINEFEYVINSTMEAIFITKNERCIDLNEEGMKLYKFNSKDEAIGQFAYNFIAEESHKLIRRNILQNFTDPFEANAIKTDGTVFPVLIRIHTTTRKKEQIRIITILDLTEIKHKDFIISNQAKMVALGEMIENIAHQWRQPLNAITTSVINMQIARELEQEMSKEEEAEYLNGIVKSAKYLSSTINDFRNFINSSSKKSKIILQDSINETLSIAKATLDGNFINLIKDFEKEPIELKSNSSELSQIVLNIINNASQALIAKAKKEKNIFVVIKKKGDSAIVTIENNGGQIPKDVLPKIFDPYFSTKKDKEGTGIGLYMSNELISKHLNGKLYAKNTKDGVKFIIELPINH